MALRAKKPTVKQTRFKALVYATHGVGKTHLCCSFPGVYYIDTENLEDYPHFVKMIIDNKGDLIKLNEISEIINEVKELLQTKHKYKTLVIDSISFPIGWLSQLEAERLQKKAPSTEGTEFGANLAKAKRLVYQLGILLSRLDMNVIVVSHEKTKYEKGEEIGKSFDVNDKLAYSLGAVLHMQLRGTSRKLRIEKSRYKQLKTGETIDFDDGYAVLEKAFGKDVFVRESKEQTLATKEQIGRLQGLIRTLNVPMETTNKWLQGAEASDFSEMESVKIEKCIEHLRAKIEVAPPTVNDTTAFDNNITKDVAS